MSGGVALLMSGETPQMRHAKRKNTEVMSLGVAMVMR